MRDIACGSWRYRCGVFKIEILKLGGSSLAAEISAGSHNRLLRRQHCSSLCSQSEGHEHVANMTSALGHCFVGFSARAWPPQYSSPSLCEQSELQCFASALRQMSAHRPLLRHHANTDCQRTREQTQPLLGAETKASGSRDERIWEQKRASLGAETVVAGTVCSCVCSCVR